MVASKSQILDWMEKVEEVLNSQREEFLKAKQQLQIFLKKSEEVQGLDISNLLNASSKVAQKKTVDQKDPTVKDLNPKAPASKRGRKRDGISLKEAILQVLGRPSNKDGLSSKEIAEIIDNEKIWQTNGKLGVQVGTNLHTMKEDGKIAKDGKLYKIV